MPQFEETGGETGGPHLHIQVALTEKINLADFQNSIPLIRDLAVQNGLDSKISGLELTISADPPFLRPKTWHLDVLAPGEKKRIPDLDVTLDGSVFLRLIEAENASVRLKLTCPTQEDALGESVVEVELLPRNQWGGNGHLPEMLAAFVQPNEPAVERVLKTAAGLLQKTNKSSALDGYAGGPKRAWELASAIWSALASLNLDYALPPASFENAGQKVRSPAQIVESGLGTCLDLVLFFCAACEQAGLHTLIVLSEGHAFAGVWLRKEEFSTVVVDDITSLRKRLRLDELVLVEMTLLTQHPAPPFSFAIQVGANHVSEAEEAKFHLAVDVHRARMHRIKPLAGTEASTQYERSNPIENLDPVLEEAPDLPEEGELFEPLPADLDPRDRLARWQRKLLDLSLKNNLLNFKEGKKTLRLEAPDPGALEDLLSTGETLKLLNLPELMDGSDPRSQAIHEAREREDIRREHARDALQRKEVFISLSQMEMEGRLVEQFRAARTTLQEGGANTLYLAMGFLTWTRADKGEQRFRAPMVLIPVSLNRRSARSGFTLTLHEDEPRFNPTLLEMLRQDFGLNLGINDGELPHDDAGLDIAGIWKTVSLAVRDIRGWEVNGDVVLAMFSFAKHLMWKDLTERTDQLRENPVVRHLIDTPRETYPSTVPFPRPRNLDRDFGPEHTFCPLPADSSQLSAVLAAARGKDFVLIGPPGTGKSQTIANLIAQCLAEGKKVLFVSEKIAALSVVHRRLKEVGLGEFCLEIHSNKARKQEVLEKLQTAWQARAEMNQETWKATADHLKDLRQGLNTYVERMHQRHGNGLTIFEAIAQIVGGEAYPKMNLGWRSHDLHTAKDLEGLRDLVDRLEVNARAVGHTSLERHPLSAIACPDWSPLWQQRMVEGLNQVIHNCETLETAFGRFLQTTALPAYSPKRRVRKGMALLAMNLPEAFGHDWRFVLSPNAPAIAGRLREGAELVNKHRELTSRLSHGWPEDDLRDCRKGLSLLERRHALWDRLGPGYLPDVMDELKKGIGLLESAALAQGNLSVTYTDQVEAIDIFQLQRQWVQAEGSIWPLSWFRKRGVYKVLAAAAELGGTLDPAKDVHTLAKLRTLHAKISQIDLRTETEAVWGGRRTKIPVAQCAVAFQVALTAAKQRLPWEDDGFEAVAQGFCGEKCHKQLITLRSIASLDQEVLALYRLKGPTEGLWDGLDTQSDRLEAALAFQECLLTLREAGVLVGDHPMVARGDCGPGMAHDCACLKERALLEGRIAGFSDLTGCTGGVWDGLRTQTDEIAKALPFLSAIAEAIAAITEGPEDVMILREALETILGEGNHLLHPSGQAMEAARGFHAALAPLEPSLEGLAQAGQFVTADQAAFMELPPLAIASRCREMASNANRLRAWCAWQKAKQESTKAGLGPMVGAIEAGAMAGGDFRPAFETDYCRWWANAVVDQDEVIRSFVSAEHEKRIGDFRTLDDRFTQLTRSWVRAYLCAGIPDQETIPKNSDWGLLRYEMNKKKRHLPLRELMTRIPNALTCLAPCLLMSPLSIAQYLTADPATFDLVVFDEASQIPVWDAIEAIARGKQVVMVGDPKQLPPTNFFNRAESDSDDEDVEPDLESILDECLGANLPTLNLDWHYRSRNESLIAFSNHHYYGGSLVTFPSPATRDDAVSFHYVKGTYEKGGARINKPEAHALVADVVSHLMSPAFRKSKLTIGIVTFNTEQQTLIENLLDEERRKYPSLESYFADTELEPLFIKNLESVQGDERDIIYFSITFGPDHAGNVSMNFGPMNRGGGERRLNVAITRARHELRVFSSLKAEQINLSRTQAEGVRDLKYFLDFAERGAKALAETVRASQGDFESPFEEAIAKALGRKGWEVQTQIGVSAYRIDLGIVHPDAPGAYLVGIECDGATYHRSATAKDRDKLREHVLRGLGWEILRVWSTDWWIDPVGTLESLHRSLEALLEANRILRQEKEQVATNGETNLMGEEEVTLEANDAMEMDASQIVPTGTPIQAGTVPFQAPKDPQWALNPDAFFNREYDRVLGQVISDVIENEGPVLDAVLSRRVARLHGWQRTGARIQTRVEDVACVGHKTTREEVGQFFWPLGLKPGSQVPRRMDSAALERSVDEICIEELTGLAKLFLETGMSEASVLTQLARNLGLSRLKSASRERLEKAMQLAGV